MSPGHPNPALAFLSGEGELSALIAGFDWASTELGALEKWPAHVRVATSLMLRSQVPMVMLWGESGVMIYNDGYSRVAGRRHPQLLGSRVREGWPEVADFNDNVMKVGLAGGTLTLREQELVLNRDGQPQPGWMDLDYSPLLDDTGTPVGVMAIVVETTTRVLAERHMKTERERLALLFEQAPSFMVMLQGPQHRIELANPNYLQLIGRRDVVGRHLAEALPDLATQGYLELLDEVYASGKTFSATGAKYDVQVQPGAPLLERYVDFVFQPIRDHGGDVTGIFVEGVDVTERVAAEQRRELLARLSLRLDMLRGVTDIGHAASEVLGQALGASRVGYGTLADGTDILEVDRDWCAPGVDSLAGHTPLRAYGDFVNSLYTGELVAIADTRLDARTVATSAALEARHARAFVNVPLNERGESTTVLFVNHAEVREWTADELTLIRDVAQRTRVALERARSDAALRESEARLRELNENLEATVEARGRALVEVEAKYRQAQKMEAIGQLTGGIAHDFNNLLHVIGTSLEVIERLLQRNRHQDAQRYIGMSQTAVEKAALLTHRLLAFSRRQTLDPRPTDVNRLMAGLEDLVRRSVGPSIEVEVVGAGGLWLTRVDGPQLENAILNLCINARDAMQPGGGRLTLETANKWLDDRAAAERELPPGQYISVCVTDTGAGMTPEIAARAFDPFYTTKSLGEGTGLGLSMVYGFVRQSGGQVRIYSEVSQGTTVCLYLPRHGEAGEVEPPSLAALPRVDGHGEVVMLIEDEANIRLLITEELGAAGYQVVTAGTGAEGLEQLQALGRVDLLITDVGLPGGMNGRQVADAARVQRPALRVLFITGYAENAAVGNGLLAPGMQVITKPFALTDLVAKVAELVLQPGSGA